jgi:hypothetical protein
MFLFLVITKGEFERMLEREIVVYFIFISERVLEGPMKAVNNLK